MYPIYVVGLVVPVPHVEGDDGDPDVLGGLLVHVRELEPGVVLLLPGLEGALPGEGRLGALTVRQELIKQLVLDRSAVISPEDGYDVKRTFFYTHLLIAVFGK